MYFFSICDFVCYFYKNNYRDLFENICHTFFSENFQNDTVIFFVQRILVYIRANVIESF